eukprot:351317-Chlamydomonas_euryale.AAC.7
MVVVTCTGGEKAGRRLWQAAEGPRVCQLMLLGCSFSASGLLEMDSRPPLLHAAKLQCCAHPRTARSSGAEG